MVAMNLDKLQVYVINTVTESWKEQRNGVVGQILEKETGGWLLFSSP